MNDSAGNDYADPFFSARNEDGVQTILPLLKKVSVKGLALVAKRVREEQDRRLEEAKEAVTNMEKAFGVPEQPPARSAPAKSTTKKSAKTSRPRKTKVNKADRTPRGMAKEMILACLKDAPRTRKQVMDYFKEHGLPAGSVPTLLTRLKKSGDIEYNAENNEYSTAGNTPAASDA